MSDAVVNCGGSGVEMVSVQMSASAANNLALACNRARNMIRDGFEADDVALDERDRAMLETLGWASRWLTGAGIDGGDRGV